MILHDADVKFQLRLLVGRIEKSQKQQSDNKSRILSSNGCSVMGPLQIPNTHQKTSNVVFK